jgi:hypothetical protein
MIKSEGNPDQKLEKMDSSTPVTQNRLSISSAASSSETPTTPIDPKNAKKISKQPITKRRPRTSHIWNYSTTNPEDGITLNRDGQEVWICSMCKDRKTTYLLSGGTAAPIRHLARVHKIEPCLSHSRPRRHTKHLSEPSIMYTNSPNPTLYKNDIYQHGFGNPFLPPGMIHGMGSTGMPGMVQVLPSHLMQSNSMVPIVPSGTAPHEMTSSEDSYMFPMIVAAGPAESSYTGPAASISGDFISNPYGMQLQPSMPLSSPSYTAPSAIATAVNAVPVLGPENVFINAQLSSAPSAEASMEKTNTPKTRLCTKSKSVSKDSSSPSSVTSTPQTYITSAAKGSAISVMSTPESPLSYPEPERKKQQQQSAQALAAATGININGAIKAFMEMVSNYDVPASLIDTDCFKSFCASLNPSAAGEDTFASFKAGFRHKTFSLKSPTPSVPAGVSVKSNYTYLATGSGTPNSSATGTPLGVNPASTASAQDGYLSNNVTVYSNAFAMTAGLGETLVQPQSQVYQSDFIW